MKCAFFVLPFLLTLALADELPLAETCVEEACQLPDCKCSNINIPGGLSPRDTPQFVLLSFDGAVNIINIETYRDELYGRKSKNGCPIGTTFFVNHEYTNYVLINELYNQGFEIGLRSITNQIPQSYWAEADYETMMREFGDQKIQISHFANIPYDSIKGLRLPFLQMSGNASFEMMTAVGLEYDNSWPTIAYTNPGLWPYTLDYASIQDCNSPPCPTASIPGAWVLSMLSWFDLSNLPCAIVNNCFSVPPLDNENAWFQFFVTNFERQYLGNRAPFGFSLNEAFFTIYPVARGAYRRFVDLVTNLDDVFVVNSQEVIEWARNPIPINEYKQKACRTFISTTCPETNCGPLTSEHNELLYWMQICNVCPNVYPWLNNPLGL